MKIFRLFIIFLFLLTGQPLFAVSDTEFLEMVMEKTFNFFWEEVDINTGLIKDKALNDPYITDSEIKASIASVGFGLTGICIGHSRKWITYDEAYERVLTTLQFFHIYVYDKKGFFYHYYNMLNHQRWNTGTEMSSIDTALLVAGILFAGQYFKGTEIETLANEIYLNVDWKWMCGATNFISMGWKPESSGNFTIPYDEGFLCTSKWEAYNEGFLADILAIGSPTHPPLNSPKCWTTMQRPVGTYAGYTYIYDFWSNPMFIHQFPQCWVDLRYRTYNSTNYYENSQKATHVNRIFSVNTNNYNQDCWGLTACDGYSGYYAYSAQPCSAAVNNDGTISPDAAGGSIIFTPVESIKALHHFYNNYKTGLWGKYGFSSCFNPKENWYSSYVYGIEQGPILLSIENYLTGMVWDEFMKISYINNALKTMGFVPTSDITRPETISDLQVYGNKLVWKAPVDNNGKVKKYIIKYLTRSIDKPADWYEAEEIENSIVPASHGETETFIVKNIPEGTYYFAVKSEDEAGNKSLLSNSTDDVKINKVENKLLQNFPNPFNLNKNSITTIRYIIQKQGNVRLKLCSIMGKLIKEWMFKNQTQGYHQFNWDGKSKSNKTVEPGIYVLLMELDDRNIDEKNIIVIK